MDVECQQRQCDLSPIPTGADPVVMAAQAGDAQAFGELWIRHSGMVFRQVMRIVKNREDAEDIMQDTFLRAFVHLDKFEARSQFSTWLTRIAVNGALMILRKERGRPTMSIDSRFEAGVWSQLEVEDPRPDLERLYIKHERDPLMRSAIARMRPSLSAVIQHQIMNECSLAETAQYLGLTVPAAKSRVARARRTLRKALIRYK
jgi:RNA polymerase sigma factor (sigma-70 family)